MVNDMTVRLISEVVSPSKVRTDEPMSRHTTFRIGGKADLLVEPAEVNQVEAVLKLLRQMQLPYLVIGNGSNLLVGDKGVRGAVVKLGNEFSAHDIEGEIITAQSGLKLSRLANFALGNCMTGLEFAAGIPGTVGGALYMNAGAYGGEMKQVVQEVTFLDEKGNRRTISGGECEFGYRSSIFSRRTDWVILSCKLALKPGNPESIKATMEDLAERRTSKQPLNYPSAGSTFKRPEGYFAGKLIQDAGLMGFRVGGASVSEKHAGFVINDRNATAKDVLELIEAVQNKVEEKFGVRLEPEVRLIGEF